MLTTPPSRWAVQGLTFVLWGLAAASAVYWGFKLATRPATGPVLPASARGPATPDPAAIARLLGASRTAAAAPVASLASRFSLVGVVARPSRAGIALISVDGKPPRPYRVGTAIEEGLLLQAVESRRALLGPDKQGPPALTLELPLRK